MFVDFFNDLFVLFPFSVDLFADGLSILVVCDSVLVVSLHKFDVGDFRGQLNERVLFGLAVDPVGTFFEVENGVVVQSDRSGFSSASNVLIGFKNQNSFSVFSQLMSSGHTGNARANNDDVVLIFLHRIFKTAREKHL